MQANLLRVVQERSVIPVGGVEGIPVDVRIVAATNRDLQKEVDRGTFREDLYYRLNVGVLHTMPLADRREDVEVLAYHFLTDMAEQAGLPRKSLSRGAVDLLSAYHWPGNVRQLRNVLERSLVCAKGEQIDEYVIGRMLDVDPPPSQRGADEGLLPDPTGLPADDCSEGVISEARRQYPGCGTDPSQWLTLDNLERYHIQQTLAQALYNQTAAAKMLDVTPRVLAGKVKKLGINVSASRPGRPKRLAA
jgi:DNA-binding NtrC family response regulator